ncbi:unnamed protein product [Chrysoparadoxa australica]
MRPLRCWGLLCLVFQWLSVESWCASTKALPCALSRRSFIAACSFLAVSQGAPSQANEGSPSAAVKEGQQSAVLEGISGFASGAAVSSSKLMLLHPLDTIKLRLQLPVQLRRADLFQNLYSGVLPPLLGGVPSGAVFFASKDALSQVAREALLHKLGGAALPRAYENAITVAAVGLAQFPYWGIRTPSEVLKSRLQADGQGAQGVAETKKIMVEDGVEGLYLGYLSNIAYAFPADAIKFLVYDAMKYSTLQQRGTKLSALESAALGSIASAVSQVAASPVDVVRTRIMTQERVRGTASEKAESQRKNKSSLKYTGIAQTLALITEEEGISTLWSGIVPRLLRSVVSGGIQFASYETTKAWFNKR